MKIVRNLIREFYGIGATPTYSPLAPFTKCTEENAPVIDKSAYIADTNSTPTVTGYENKWGFEAHYEKGDPVVDDLVEIAREQKTGTDCERMFVSVDLSMEDNTTAGSYYARRCRIAVEATPPTGDPKSITKITGNFHQCGDLEYGLFALATKTFTVGTYTPKV